MAGKRMSRDRRRQQLLDTAAAIVRAEGADALTLARLAEQAGVTRPIAYGHFGSRSGLLAALYRHYDDRQTEAARRALAEQARSLKDAVDILSAAYVDCVLAFGPEYGAIAAALAATGDMEAFRESLREGYVDLYRVALAPFGAPTGPEATALLTGVLGAADTLSQAAAAGRIDRRAAVEALSRIMWGAVAPASSPGPDQP
ncbi:MAG: TetR/AcrR family transcriptional regulator [Pseudomonadota bacterium]